MNFRKNDLVITKVANGFLLEEKGSLEDQQDSIFKLHVFETVEKLTAWLKSRFEGDIEE